MHLETVCKIAAIKAIVYGHHNHRALLMAWVGDDIMIGIVNHLILC